MTTTTRTDFEFDTVFTVAEDGTATERHDLYAPSVFHDEATDVYVDGPHWTPLTGRTGQYGYSGAVLHASEQFAGNLESYVMSTPGTYVLVVVNVLPDEDDEDPEPAGWAILRRDTCSCPPNVQCPAVRFPYDETAPAYCEQCGLDMDTRDDDEPSHVAYPHHPGYLFDCPACEARCHCTPGNAECVFSGEHNGSADA